MRMKNEIDRDDQAYSEYTKTDPIRRFQFDYDEHVALVSVFPAAKVDGNTLTKKNPSHASSNNNFADVAPGKGQTPTSILKERKCDIKTYPHLYPDGKHGMNAESRKAKLSNQQYIKQRLFNVDTVSSYRKIHLWDSNEIRMQIRKLDPDQTYILDLFVKYARCYKMAKGGFCMFPTPPLLVIEGDAGSGKSELIKFSAKHWKKNFVQLEIIQTNFIY